MKKNKIRAYFIRVDERTGQQYRGYFGEIENILKPKQDYVGYGKPHSIIQVVHLNDEIDIICDEEGKLKYFPCNRAWYDIDRGGKRQLLDILVGNIMCVRHDDIGNFTDILESDRAIIEDCLRPIAGIVGSNVFIRRENELPEYKEG